DGARRGHGDHAAGGRALLQVRSPWRSDAQRRARPDAAARDTRRADLDETHRPQDQHDLEAASGAPRSPAGRLQAGIRPPEPKALSGRRDFPRHVSALGQPEQGEARQGPIPPRPGRRRRSLPGGLPPPGDWRGLHEVKVRVLVRLKPGIMDVQGAAVKRALAGLGFSELKDLRVGKVIDVDVADATPQEARTRVGEMCRQLLANPILEDYTIETVDDLAPREAGR